MKRIAVSEILLQVLFQKDAFRILTFSALKFLPNLHLRFECRIFKPDFEYQIFLYYQGPGMVYRAFMEELLHVLAWPSSCPPVDGLVLYETGISGGDLRKAIVF